MSALEARRSVALSVACGAVFGLGLVTSGMSNPAKVLAFLDVAGAWDPSLAFVMAGAIGVHAPLLRLVLRRSAPSLGPRSWCPGCARSMGASSPAPRSSGSAGASAATARGRGS